MSRARDHIEIVEAAYALDRDHDEWLRELTAVIRRHWGEVASFTYSAASYELSVCETEELEIQAAVHRGICALARRVGRGRNGGATVKPLLPAADLGAVCDLVLLRVPTESLELIERAADLDEGGSGVCLALGERELSARDEQNWRHLAYHISYAYRLRCALGQVAASSEALRSSGAREVMRATARAVMSARERVVDELQTIWEGLITGSWSLVDRFDAGQRSVWVVHRGGESANDPRALTAREIEVARQLARGLSNKVIGDVLCLSPSTVATHVTAIARKLDARSRVELVRLLGASTA